MKTRPHLLLCRLSSFAGALAAPFVSLFGAAPDHAESDRAFFDREIASMMEQHNVPGVAAVLVRRDGVEFTAGYGFADLQRRSPIDPERTVFPLGSISKLLTSIAALQLVDSGAVDLHTDVRAYLHDAPIDDRFDAPITLHHLLTHTDGFDARWLVGGAARIPEKVLPLSAMIARLPPRTLPPGEVYVYSDVGITLAGYLVERVSRQPFADYVEQRIFRPLGMTRTTFSPRREFYSRDRATGYEYDRQGRFRSTPIVYPHANPASGVTAPVADIAPLIEELLRAFRTGTSVLLGPDSVSWLGEKRFAHHPSFPGTGYGFYELFHNGRRALVHGGMLPGFTAVLVLLPEADVGVCIAANRFDLIAALEDDLLRKIIDRFAPPPPAPAPPIAVAPPAPAAARLGGRYRCDQYSHFSIDKIFVLAGLADEIEVEAQSDGSLLFHPHGARWLPVEPLLYQQEGSTERVRFEIDENGRGQRILGSVQFMSYHRIDFWDDYRRHTPIGAILVALTAIGGLLGAWRMVRWLGYHGANCGRAMHLQRLTAMLLPTTIVLMAAGLAWILRDLDFLTAAFGEPRSIAWLRLIPLATAIIALVLLVVGVRSIRRDRVHRLESWVYVASATAALLLLPFLIHWQLVRVPTPVVAFVVRCLSPSVL